MDRSRKPASSEACFELEHEFISDFTLLEMPDFAPICSPVIQKSLATKPSCPIPCNLNPSRSRRKRLRPKSKPPTASAKPLMQLRHRWIINCSSEENSTCSVSRNKWTIQRLRNPRGQTTTHSVSTTHEVPSLGSMMICCDGTSRGGLNRVHR